MTGLLTNFNFLLAYGEEHSLRNMDSKSRRQLLEKIVRAGPSERTWRALLELLASWPEDEAKEQAYDWLRPQLASWGDKIRNVNSAWTFLYGDDDRLTSIAKIVRSVTISHREQFGNKELKSIVNTSDIRDITTLIIQKSDIYIEGARALACSPYLTHLTTLALEGVTLSDEKFDILFSAANLNNLSTLRLKDVGLDTDRVHRLLRSPLIRSVHHLELPHNNLNDETALLLAASLKLKDLRTLDLRGNSIREQTALALMNSPLRSENITIIVE